MIKNDQELRLNVGKKWLLKEILRIGEYKEEQIKEALSGEEGGDEELMSEAARAIEMIEQGEQPKINRGANTSFIRKIANYAIDNSETDEIYSKLMNYALDHMMIAETNANIMSSITQQDMTQQGMQPQQQPLGIQQTQNELSQIR